MNLTELEKILNKKSEYLLNNELKLSSEVKQLQTELFNLLTRKTLAELQLDANGNIAKTSKNFNIINNVDKVFDEFNNKYQSEVINNFGKNLLSVTDYSKEYFSALGFTNTAILKGIEKLGWIEKSIGFVDNKIIPGGYLDTLMQNEIVRQEVKQLMIKNLAGNKGLKDVTKDLKKYIKGVGEQSGKLERYYKQYAYDTFNQVDETINTQLAEELGLKYFIYSGTEIKTTREFCRERFGHAFTREEAEAWDREDWAGKSGPFFPNRGGYNCRHRIKWITKAMYERITS